MATYNQGILGAFSGKVGTVIGTTWKGRHIMKARATSYHNANTPLQLAQRMRFSLMMQFLKNVKPQIDLGFAPSSQSMSPFNVAMRDNLNEAVTGSYPDIEIDFSKISLSRGSRTGLTDMSALSAAPGSITLSWDEVPADGNGMPADKLYATVVNNETGDTIIYDPTAIREDGNMDLDVPQDWSGKEVTVLGFFLEDSPIALTNTNQVSNTDRATVTVATGG